MDCLGVRFMSERNKPVVLVGAYEHHSNLLPWRESGCEILTVKVAEDGVSLDLAHLQHLLDIHAPIKRTSNRMIIGAFSAMSNLT